MKRNAGYIISGIRILQVFSSSISCNIASMKMHENFFLHYVIQPRKIFQMFAITTYFVDDE